MPHVAPKWEHLEGRVIGNGHCIPLVREACGLPPTAHWRRGERVQGAGHILPGTAVATFHGDRYASATDGSSHAALFLEHRGHGSIKVMDQWVGHPASYRVIREKFGAGPAVDDAGKYYVVELVE